MYSIYFSLQKKEIKLYEFQLWKSLPPLQSVGEKTRHEVIQVQFVVKSSSPQSMLVRRVVTRPATTIRQAYRLQRRFILPSRPQLQAPRPNLRFQADGKPPLAPETYNFLKNCEYPSKLLYNKLIDTYLKVLCFFPYGLRWTSYTTWLDSEIKRKT